MISKSKGLNFLGQFLLLTATVAWGSSFIILKETINALPALYVIGIRFLIAALLIGVIFFGKIRKTDKKTFINGVILGLVLTGAYITQTLGLKYITAGKNAFITSLNCVMCPFMVWMIFGVKPKSYNIISAVLCVIGIGFVAISGSGEDSNMILGSVLTFACAVFYGLQIVFTGKFHESKSDVMQLLFIQLLIVGVLITACSLAFELPFCGIEAYKIGSEQVWRIVYLTLICTLYTQLTQIVSLKFTESNQAAIILSLEAVFGVIFAILIGDEKITPTLWAGFGIIFIGTLLSELRLDVFKLFGKKNKTAINADAEKEELE
ncbi:MAG: DMT family transporter [Clostridia bacterium]|nr:DMT family transporter [Clostridia bacterium]